jgi:hypothetical protein
MLIMFGWPYCLYLFESASLHNKKQRKGCLEIPLPWPHNVWELSASCTPLVLILTNWLPLKLVLLFYQKVVKILHVNQKRYIWKSISTLCVFWIHTHDYGCLRSDVEMCVTTGTVCNCASILIKRISVFGANLDRSCILIRYMHTDF